MFSKGGCFHDCVEVDQVKLDGLAAASGSVSRLVLVTFGDALNMSDAVAQAQLYVMTCPFGANP